jgi:hypothetical protein
MRWELEYDKFDAAHVRYESLRYVDDEGRTVGWLLKIGGKFFKWSQVDKHAVIDRGERIVLSRHAHLIPGVKSWRAAKAYFETLHRMGEL